MLRDDDEVRFVYVVLRDVVRVDDGRYVIADEPRDVDVERIVPVLRTAVLVLRTLLVGRAGNAVALLFLVLVVTLFCCVDVPLLRPLVVVPPTGLARIAVLRFTVVLFVDTVEVARLAPLYATAPLRVDVDVAPRRPPVVVAVDTEPDWRRAGEEYAAAPPPLLSMRLLAFTLRLSFSEPS